MESTKKVWKLRGYVGFVTRTLEFEKLVSCNAKCIIPINLFHKCNILVKGNQNENEIEIEIKREIAT